MSRGGGVRDAAEPDIEALLTLRFEAEDQGVVIA